MTLIHSTRPRVAAYANWGRWVAECPSCPGALTLAPGTPTLTCWDCGADAEIVWPADNIVRGVERLLMMRPNVITRNWTPGESLHDLLDENVTHGIWTGDVGDQLTIVGDEITRDTLPAREFQPAIGGR